MTTMLRPDQVHSDPRLAIQVAAFVFDASPDSLLTLDTALLLNPRAICIVIAEPAEIPKVREHWVRHADATLLVFHCASSGQAEMAVDAVRSLRSGPIALLLAGCPKSLAISQLWPSKAIAATARRLEAARPGLQVLPFSTSWSYRPPRIR